MELRVLLLTASDVEELLDLDHLVDAVAAALAEVSAGGASMPPRVAALVPERQALLAAMPAFLPKSDALITKLVTLFPLNVESPTHQAIICAFDPQTGSPTALMDGTYITAARTAAGSVLATRLLARADAHAVSILGTGVQAATHARAFSRVGGFDSIWIGGRDKASVARLVESLAAEGIAAQAAPSIEAAVRAGDVVCTATHAGAPVLRREWLLLGAHINSVGYNTAGTGEVGTDVISDALVVVESRAAALAEPPAGSVEINLAVASGAIDAGEVVEVGELLVGRAAGRRSREQLTFYKSVGVAAQDAAAAALVLRAARERGIGSQLDL